ncbi:MAG: spermidine/putrescine ABC transporter substrate-binding protein [Firmicutes bacterium]|nr:spermidine/putrescine ABC transporter substrate-binding protein [Candidatus Colimorpha enterica]
MKKLLIFALILISALLLCSCASSESGDEDDVRTLYVYNWGEYISDGSEDTVNVNKEFEKYYLEKYGKKVKVNYSTYASNEDLYAKLSSGAVSYDVVIPSDYMVARLIAEKLIQPINPAENIPLYGEIDDQFKSLYYDPDNAYSVPYTFGTVGVIYNTSMVEENDPDIGSWNLMWSEKYKGNILQFNNPRDAFATALEKLGYSLNTEKEEEWKAAFESLKEQKNVVQGYVMDEVFNKMKGGSAAVGAYYTGDFLTMYADNEDLAFFYPEEGNNVYVDAMCIPTNAQSRDLALEWINFVLTEDIAVANAEYICYASPVKSVRSNPDYVEYMTEEIHPDAIELLYSFNAEKMEYFFDLPDDTRNLMNSLWEDLKIESTIGSEIYVICGIIVAVLVVAIVTSSCIKKYRNKKKYET